MRIALFVMLAAAALASCKSKAPKTQTELMSPQLHPDVQSGSYYRTKGFSTAFYDEQPDSLIGKVPTHLLGARHIVQLLDPNAGGGWARVRTEKGDIGFIKFKNIKIVPFEKQPKAPKPKREYWND